MAAVARVWPIVTVFVVVIGGIYGGIFTPTEAAAMGTIATTALAVLSRELDFKGFTHAVFGAAESTAMIFLILLGADCSTPSLRSRRCPQALAQWVLGSGLSPAAVLIGIILVTCCSAA